MFRLVRMSKEAFVIGHGSVLEGGGDSRVQRSVHKRQGCLVRALTIEREVEFVGHAGRLLVADCGFAGVVKVRVEPPYWIDVPRELDVLRAEFDVYFGLQCSARTWCRALRR